LSVNDENPTVSKGPVTQPPLNNPNAAKRRGEPLGTREFDQAGRTRNAPARESLQERPFAATDSSAEVLGRARRPMAEDRDYAHFHDRVRKGRVKFCSACGGIMRKSSRRILSAPAGILLVILGALLMVLYGLATNFYQVPWFAAFALPAGYYLGSLFVGIGVLFFFIRERVWICPSCREMSKR
jgi:hypothetical protein